MLIGIPFTQNHFSGKIPHSFGKKILLFLKDDRITLHKICPRFQPRIENLTPYLTGTTH
jgi:hypothetical protein